MKTTIQSTINQSQPTLSKQTSVSIIDSYIEVYVMLLRPLTLSCQRKLTSIPHMSDHISPNKITTGWDYTLLCPLMSELTFQSNQTFMSSEPHYVCVLTILFAAIHSAQIVQSVYFNTQWRPHIDHCSRAAKCIVWFTKHSKWSEKPPVWFKKY